VRQSLKAVIITKQATKDPAAMYGHRQELLQLSQRCRDVWSTVP
jgi:hypothetical protein